MFLIKNLLMFFSLSFLSFNFALAIPIKKNENSEPRPRSIASVNTANTNANFIVATDRESGNIFIYSPSSNLTYPESVVQGDKIQIYNESAGYLYNLANVLALPISSSSQGVSSQILAMEASRNKLYTIYRDISSLAILDASSGQWITRPYNGAYGNPKTIGISNNGQYVFILTQWGYVIKYDVTTEGYESVGSNISVCSNNNHHSSPYIGQNNEGIVFVNCGYKLFAYLPKKGWVESSSPNTSTVYSMSIDNRGRLFVSSNNATGGGNIIELYTETLSNNSTTFNTYFKVLIPDLYDGAPYIEGVDEYFNFITRTDEWGVNHYNYKTKEYLRLYIPKENMSVKSGLLDNDGNIFLSIREKQGISLHTYSNSSSSIFNDDCIGNKCQVNLLSGEKALYYIFREKAAAGKDNYITFGNTFQLNHEQVFFFNINDVVAYEIDSEKVDVSSIDNSIGRFKYIRKSNSSSIRIYATFENNPERANGVDLNSYSDLVVDIIEYDGDNFLDNDRVVFSVPTNVIGEITTEPFFLLQSNQNTISHTDSFIATSTLSKIQRGYYRAGRTVVMDSLTCIFTLGLAHDPCQTIYSGAKWVGMKILSGSGIMPDISAQKNSQLTSSAQKFILSNWGVTWLESKALFSNKPLRVVSELIACDFKTIQKNYDRLLLAHKKYDDAVNGSKASIIDDTKYYIDKSVRQPNPDNLCREESLPDVGQAHQAFIDLGLPMNDVAAIVEHVVSHGNIGQWGSNAANYDLFTQAVIRLHDAGYQNSDILNFIQTPITHYESSYTLAAEDVAVQLNSTDYNVASTTAASLPPSNQNTFSNVGVYLLSLSEFNDPGQQTPGVQFETQVLDLYQDNQSMEDVLTVLSQWENQFSSYRQPAGQQQILTQAADMARTIHREISSPQVYPRGTQLFVVRNNGNIVHIAVFKPKDGEIAIILSHPNTITAPASAVKGAAKEAIRQIAIYAKENNIPRIGAFAITYASAHIFDKVFNFKYY